MSSETATQPHGQAAEILRLALPLMARHEVPVIPRNYAVFYAYVAGENEALGQALEPLLAAAGPIPGQALEALYHTHVATLDARITDRAREALKQLLSATSASFSEADAELSHFGAFLDGIGGRLAASASEEEVRGLVSDLTAATSTVQGHGEQLLHRLEESQREVEALREQLEQTRRAASLDALTGLANRGVFDARIEALASDPHGGGFGLLLVDIDSFKAINDTHGHLVGDKVIRFVGQTLIERTKGRDLAARYGGEEFAVLLPETDLRGSRTVAESVRAAVERAKLVKAGTREPLGRVTVSLGVAAHRPGEPVEAVVERADRALYCSKRSGRNRVSDEAQLAEAGAEVA